MDIPLPSYAELTAELARLRSRNAELEAALSSATTARGELSATPAPPLDTWPPLFPLTMAGDGCLECLLAHAPIGIALLDTELRYQYINIALAALNGQSPAAYLGHTIREVFPLIAPDLELRLTHVLKTGDLLLDMDMIPAFPVGPDAPHTWKASYFPVGDSRGGLVGVGVVVIPGATPLVGQLSRSLRSTEQALIESDQLNAALEQRVLERTYALEQALTDLRASETKYRALFQTLPVGVLVVDDQGQYVEYNDVARDLLGLELAEHPVRCAAELTRRMIDERGYLIPLSAYPSIRGAYACEAFRDLEVGIVAPDQPEPISWVSSYVAPLDLPQHGAVIVLSDISKRKRAEQALAASEARLRALRDALPDMLFIVRADGTFLEFYTSRQSEVLVPPEQFLGRTFDEMLPAELVAVMRTAIARVHESGQLELIEFPFTVRERKRILEARVAPIPIQGDELLFIVRDITERRQATEELLRAKEAAETADRIKSTFLAHISHEIRTPLTAVIGMTSLLRDTDLSPLQQNYAATIHTGAETLMTIIGNILDFSKIEAGQMELSAQPFDLRACLKDALDLVAHQARHKGLVLEKQIDPTVPNLLVGDVARLRQVLVNLLSNAVKFTERGTVTLTLGGWSLTEKGYDLVLTIRDTGIGIATDRLDQIFDPFVQADSTTTRRFGGTGLGLAISKQLVELMGGCISVSSTLGMGSTFTLYLPMISAPDALLPMAQKVAEEIRPPEQLKMLLAEDNLVNQEVIRRLLESLGYSPTVVANGAEALAAVTQQAYDVVLMDIQMPELDGETATRRIRALGGDAQPYIIALTASALFGDRERYLAAGMDNYLSKPVQRDELRAILRHVHIHHAQPSLVPSALQLTHPAEPICNTRLVDWPLLDRLIASISAIPTQAHEIVLDLFRGKLSAQINEIIAAVTANDRPQVRLLAHKLRGGSHQLGATWLAEHWLALESAAQCEDVSLLEILDSARRTYDDTLALLTARLLDH